MASFKARKITDGYDIEAAAFEVAQHFSDGDDEVAQAYFAPIRDAMLEAYNAGRRSMTIKGRIREAVQNFKLNH